MLYKLTSGFLLLLLFACEQDAVPTSLPQIFKMTLPGVPDDAITIDEANHRITVLLPPTLLSLQLTPSFELTRGASVIGVPIDFSSFCPCSGAFSVSGLYQTPFIVNIKGDFRVLYEVTLKPGLPLKLVPSLQPITIEAMPNPTPEKPFVVYLPAENYFGNNPIQAISVAKVGQAPNWIGGGDACFNFCPAQLNKVGVALSGYRGTGALTPGDYEVQLRLAGSSSILKFPQSITIR